MHHDRRPFIAGLLNFLVPGTGLLYLGYRRAALINFGLVNLILVVLTFVWTSPAIIEHIHYVFLGLAALSAGYAHGVATTRTNQRPNSRSPRRPRNTPETGGFTSSQT